MSGDDAQPQARLIASVRGRVQGVGFRWFVRTQAQRLRLRGWTANQPDGSVTVVAEGPTELLDELATALAQGPDGASVDQVVTRLTAATGEFARFTIRAGAHRGD